MGKVADLLAARKPRIKRVRLPLDGDAATELDRLRSELRVLRSVEEADGTADTLKSQEPILERKIQELGASLLANAAEFEFKAIGRAAFEAIKSKYPPAANQWELYREHSQANPLIQPPTFDQIAAAPELIAESASDPTMTLEEAQALWDELSDGEAALIYNAVWSVNMEAASIPLSATGIEGIEDSDENSIMRQVTESLGLSTPGES